MSRLDELMRDDSAAGLAELSARLAGLPPLDFELLTLYWTDRADALEGIADRWDELKAAVPVTKKEDFRIRWVLSALRSEPGAEPEVCELAGAALADLAVKLRYYEAPGRRHALAIELASRVGKILRRVYGIFGDWWESHPLLLASAIGRAEHMQAVADWCRPKPSLLRLEFHTKVCQQVLTKRDASVLAWLVGHLDSVVYQDIEALGSILLDGGATLRPAEAEFCRALLDNPRLTPRDAISCMEVPWTPLSVWALEALGAVARLDLRLIWIAAVVTARPRAGPP